MWFDLWYILLYHYLKTMVTLLRADGSTIAYTTAEAEAILARLVAADLNFCIGQDDVAHMKAGNTLYIIDAAVQYNRRLLEQFTITFQIVIPSPIKGSIFQPFYIRIFVTS